MLKAKWTIRVKSKSERKWPTNQETLLRNLLDDFSYDLADLVEGLRPLERKFAVTITLDEG